MKQLIVLAGSWLLALSGAALIFLSPWIAWFLVFSAWVAGKQVGNLIPPDGVIMVRMLPWMALGVVGVLSGVHLREMGRAGKL